MKAGKLCWTTIHLDRFDMKYLLLFFTFLSFSVSGQSYEKFEIEDGLMAYRTFGEGYPVLIINGGPGMNSHGFASLAESLSADNRTIIYDQRGTGESGLNDMSASKFTIQKMVEDIEALRKHLGYDQWIVLGHSFGGMLAYAYAAEYPGRVRAMIQSHSGGMDLDIRNGLNILSRLSQAERDSLTHYAAKIRLGDDSKETALKRARFLAPAYLYDKSLAPKIAERLTQGNMIINGRIWNDLDRIDFDVSAEMSRFEKPVLILNGENEVAPQSIAEKAHSILPNSRLVVIPECGHYGWLERPDIYLKEVSDFLKINSGQLN